MLKVIVLGAIRPVDSFAHRSCWSKSGIEPTLQALTVVHFPVLFLEAVSIQAC